MIGSQVLGRYRVVRPLARGGMGVVYLGRIEGAEGFSKPVVIKQILPQLTAEKETREQFVREARILSDLHHPNIVTVLDFGVARDTYVMVLEYVHGYSLAHWFQYLIEQDQTLDPECSILVCIRILDALAHAHEYVDDQGVPAAVIHRDVSPGNVMLDIEGGVKLLDFGIARQTSSKEHRIATESGTVKGKFSYVAPEIYRGATASPRSDLYAVGVVLYQLLSGANPFRCDDARATMNRVLDYVPPPLSALRDDVPPGLDEVVARALAKSPEERFESASAMAQALRDLIAHHEGEVSAQLRRALRRDFFGGLPAAMGVESLEERQAAWRKAEWEETGRDALEGPITKRTDSGWQPLGGEASAEEPLPSTKPALTRMPVAKPAVAGSRVSWWLVVSLAVVAVIAAATALGLSLHRSQAPSGPRYLVVEGNAEPSSEPVSVAATASGTVTQPSSTSVAEATATLVVSPGGGGVAPRQQAAEPVEKLTQRVAQHQGAFSACFSRSASSVSGAPQVTLRFEVTQGGSVSRVTLVPGSLEGTELGQCLTGVARRIAFGAQASAVAFSIPITARTTN